MGLRAGKSPLAESPNGDALPSDELTARLLADFAIPSDDQSLPKRSSAAQPPAKVPPGFEPTPRPDAERTHPVGTPVGKPSTIVPPGFEPLPSSDRKEDYVKEQDWEQSSSTTQTQVNLEVTDI